MAVFFDSLSSYGGLFSAVWILMVWFSDAWILMVVFFGCLDSYSCPFGPTRCVNNGCGQRNASTHVFLKFLNFTDSCFFSLLYLYTIQDHLIA